MRSSENFRKRGIFMRCIQILARVPLIRDNNTQMEKSPWKSPLIMARSSKDFTTCRLGNI
jgi:hypothetical protein